MFWAGCIGKIVSPQILAIAASSGAQSTGSVGESEILRKVAPWSLGLLHMLCILDFLATQSALPIIWSSSPR
ncbi:hypothetical protein [Flaviflexus massiliensis]|uniref:hypothetical protein n=1 Tax=Flaviflexus massiliensis TaxID=1522309 RepID=UPI0011CA8B0C